MTKSEHYSLNLTVGKILTVVNVYLSYAALSILWKSMSLLKTYGIKLPNFLCNTFYLGLRLEHTLYYYHVTILKLYLLQLWCLFIHLLGLVVYWNALSIKI